MPFQLPPAGMQPPWSTPAPRMVPVSRSDPQPPSAGTLPAASVPPPNFGQQPMPAANNPNQQNLQNLALNGLGTVNPPVNFANIPATNPLQGRPVPQPPGSGYLRGGLNIGNPQVGPTIRGNGMPNPTVVAPLMGTNPQFNRIR